MSIQSSLPVTKVCEEALNDGRLSSGGEVVSKDLESLNAQYTQFLNDTVFQGILNPASSILFIHPSPGSHVPSVHLTASIQANELPQKAHYTVTTPAIVAEAAPIHVKCEPPSEGGDKYDDTPEQKQAALPACAPSKITKTESIPNFVYKYAREVPGEDLSPLYSTEEEWRNLVLSCSTKGNNVLHRWRIEPDGRVIGPVNQGKGFIVIAKTITRLLFNAELPVITCDILCEVVYSKAGEDRVVWPAKLIGSAKKQTNYLHCPQMAKKVEKSNACWVTMKSVKRSGGEKIQIELLEMHEKCPFQLNNSTKFKPAKTSKQMPTTETARKRPTSQRDIDGLASVNATRVVKREKTERNLSQPTSTRIIKRPHSPNVERWRQQRRQVVQAPSTSDFPSYVSSNFSLSFVELMALPSMLEEMHKSGRLELFETYLRSGHPNAQQVLDDALGEYMNN